MPIHDPEHEPTPNLPDDVTEAIKLLYPRYGEAVYRTIYRIILDPVEAQDLTQETFVRAYRAWDRFDRTNARAWLLRIASNLAITHYRSQRRHRRVPPWRLLPEGGVEGPGQPSEDKDLVAWLMRPLTAEQRALITLHYYQQIPRGEIAVQLGIPLGTVASRMNKAMQVLRRRAQAIGVVESPERVPDRLRVSLPPVEVVLSAARGRGGGGAVAGRQGAAGSGGAGPTGATTSAGRGPTAFLWQQWVAVMALIAVAAFPTIHLWQTSGGYPSNSDAAVTAPSVSSQGGGAGPGSAPGPPTRHNSGRPGSGPPPSAHPNPGPSGSAPAPSMRPGAASPPPAPGTQTATPDPSTPVAGPPATQVPGSIATPSPVQGSTPPPSPIQGPTSTPTPVQGPTPVPTPVQTPTASPAPLPSPGQTPPTTSTPCSTTQGQGAPVCVSTTSPVP